MMVPNNERDDLPHDVRVHHHSPDTDDNLAPNGDLDTLRLSQCEPPHYLYIIARYGAEVKQKM